MEISSTWIAIKPFLPITPIPIAIHDTYHKVNMRRDISILVFRDKHSKQFVCRACYNTSHNIRVIRNCSDIFVRTCDSFAKIPFNNKEHDIILSTKGFCDIKQYNHGDCLAHESCNNCSAKQDAIQRYKMNNNLY